MDHIYLRLDSTDKPVFVLPHGQALSIETAHRWYPQLKGMRTALAIEKVRAGDKGSIAVVELTDKEPH